MVHIFYAKAEMLNNNLRKTNCMEIPTGADSHAARKALSSQQRHVLRPEAGASLYRPARAVGVVALPCSALP